MLQPQASQDHTERPSRVLIRALDLRQKSLGLRFAGKQALWDALRYSPDVVPRGDLDRLEARARSPREVVEMERLAVAREALT